MRATEQEVLDIMDTTLTTEQLTPYLISANAFVTNTFSGKGLSDDILKEVERWVAAHMVATTKDRQIKETGADNAYIKYTGYWSEGLNATSYGQMAIALDSTGTLAILAKGKRGIYIYAVEHPE